MLLVLASAVSAASAVNALEIVVATVTKRL
jgi:hypothetical protein